MELAVAAGKLSALLTVDHLRQRAKRASREKFLDALKEVPDVEPADYDRLPEGYERSNFEALLDKVPDVPPLPGDEL